MFQQVVLQKFIVYQSSTKNNVVIALITLLASQWPLFAAASSEDIFNRTDRLSPEKLVALVLQHNPDIQAASSAAHAARERIVQVGAFDDPVIKYSVAPRTLSNPDIDARHSIALSQRLPWTGKRKLKQERARYHANASEENIQRSRLELTELARLAFAQWYFVHAALGINRHNQSLVDEFKEIADIKYSAGKVSKQDVLQAEMQILLLQQQAIRLHRERQEILSSLNVLLNRAVDAFIPEPENIPAIDATANRKTLIIQALAQHPELRALQHRIAAENASIQLADKASYPDFTVNALYNGVMDPEDKRFQIGFAMNIPFGEKLQAQKRESHARLKQLQWQQQSLINTIRSQLQQSFDRLQESQQLLQLYQDSLLPLAQENLATAKQDYETGRGDFLSLITAEKNLSKIQLDQERILTHYYQRLAQLDRVLGRTHTTTNISQLDEVNTVSFHAMGEQP